MKALTFKKGGIHVPECKFTSADKIIDVELPRKVSITLKQHIGMSSSPIVKRGDHVERGQKIAEARGRVSAPVHASISGTVSNIAAVRNTAGYDEEAIIITASDEDHSIDEANRHATPTLYDWKVMTPEEIIATIADAGIVGLGGATFPTAMKLTVPKGCEAKLLIINAAECEPYLTCDDALMRAKAPEIIEGIKILMRAAKVSRAVIGIEDNKPQAYQALVDASKDAQGIEVQLLQTKYPQGGEKQLINAITGLEVPSGGIPINIGVIVVNVATSFAVYRAVACRIPLIEKVITIAGYGNYRVSIGMNLAELIKICETTNQHQASMPEPKIKDVIIGGPMMGKSTPSLDSPVEKGTSGVTVIEALPFGPEPCIRCGECVRACPMGLQPYLISTLSRFGNMAQAVAEGAKDCIECGSCNYSCPSGRPILDFIRLAKKSK